MGITFLPLTKADYRHSIRVRLARKVEGGYSYFAAASIVILRRELPKVVVEAIYFLHTQGNNPR